MAVSGEMLTCVNQENTKEKEREAPDGGDEEIQDCGSTQLTCMGNY